MTPELAHALKLAHARLDDDSDAYADEDLLGQLVEAVEQQPSMALIAADLRGAAALASAAALRQAAANQHTLACRWAEAANRALEALARVPEPEDARPWVERIDERVELAEHLTDARNDAERHRVFLQELADTFGAGDTHTSRRIEARILAHLGREPEPGDSDGTR